MPKRLPVLEEPASSLRKDGRRNLVHPADVSGRFTRLRYLVFALLIGAYVLLPFLKIGGHPALFLDIEHRRFFLFGAAFNAQDFWLAFFLFTGIGFVLIVATTLWGRIWCGYACPQTVFLEGIYRRIERWIEGPRELRLRRRRAGLSLGLIGRKLLKHLLFALLTLALSHVFLSYFVSLPSLLEMMRGSPSEHPEAFGWMAGMSALVYFDFAWFREQLCLVICPYGRLQSVLTDRDTMVIGYDGRRGEPRGKAADPEAADCVDCKRCVVVCPTGIDIRNGLQIECIGCAACVDACDQIMEKLGRARGLIRYDSLNGLEGKPKRLRRPRLLLYAALGALGLIAATTAVRSHQSFEANLLRSAGAPFARSEGQIRNSFQVHLVNKRSEETTYILEA
ncbi:MAG: cytochrome c oxidase accessory protein CcoG, partial [Myxococcales bacterium]|nr:cytochrome c oxidase accessory protein CcoG [Myxococcales bacterium]